MYSCMHGVGGSACMQCLVVIKRRFVQSAYQLDIDVVHAARETTYHPRTSILRRNDAPPSNIHAVRTHVTTPYHHMWL